MKKRNRYTLIALLLLILPAPFVAGQGHYVVAKGYEKTYRINKPSNVTEIIWEVFTSPDYTINATPEQVDLVVSETGNEVTVRWVSEGEYYLMVTMMGETGCLNKKAWPFKVEPPAQLLASTFCKDGIPWIKWDALATGFDVESIGLKLYDLNGHLVDEIENAAPSGTMPWPGASNKSGTSVPEEWATIDLNAQFRGIPGADSITVRLVAPNCESEAVVAINDTIIAWHGVSTSIEILYNDYDTGGELDSSSVIITASTGNAAFTLDPASGRVDYRPNMCFFGLDSFLYVVSNASGITSNEATVYVNVEIHPYLDSDNDSIPDIDELIVETGNLCDTDTDMDGIPNFMDPDDDNDKIATIDERGDLNNNGIPDYLEDWKSRAVDDYTTTGIDIPVWIAVLENDSSTMVPATLSIITNPGKGFVSVDAGNYELNYAPDYEFMGSDSFLYVVCDHYNICDTALVVVTIEDLVELPEVFTPNNDGYNDRYMIRNIERYPDNHFVVFNRWGNKVYEKTNYANEWDGHSNSKYKLGGQPLPVGVYFYILKYANNKVKQGGVFLQR
jgi:gliding motility-associated-like protein